MRKIICLIAIVGLSVASFSATMYALDYITCHCGIVSDDSLKTLYITAVGNGNDYSGNERFCREKCLGSSSSWSVKYEANVAGGLPQGTIVNRGWETMSLLR